MHSHTTETKILFLVLAPIFLAGGVALSHQNRTALAQGGGLTLYCEDPEIPVGIALDEAALFAEEMSKNLQKIFAGASTQIGAAETLLLLADECRAENCETKCDLTTEPLLCDVITF